MTLPDFPTKDPSGEIHLTGHRIGLLHLVHHYKDGYSPEMLVGQYPTVPHPLIHKVIAFSLENKPAVDAYVAECLGELARQRTVNPKHLDIAALRQRLEASQQAETVQQGEKT